jgi:predicted CoA-binding protein
VVSSSADGLRDILAAYRIVAVVGLSPDPHRPSHEVSAYMQEMGYRIVPVNPNIQEVLGEVAYASLRAVPEPVEIVDIFRRPEHVPAIVDDAIAIGAKVIWMQLGIADEASAARARAAGLQVVMNTCIATTHHALRSRGLL